MKAKTLIAVIGTLALFVQAARAEEKTVIRFGHFPNITHAQGVIAHALTRQGKGWFEKRLGPNVEIQWFTYNAGPSAMEAIFARSLDVTYVGPSPALNAYFKSNGEDIRVSSGAANAGAALVVKADSPIKTPADFRGKKDTITTWLVSSVKFLRDRRDIAKKIAAANVELTKWIQENEGEAQKLLIEELKAETRADFAPDPVAQAWNRIQFTSEISRDLIAKSVRDGKDAGFLKGPTDTSKLVETP